MKKQILINIFSGYLGKGIGIFLGILLIPFLIHKLGAAAFGVTVLVESIIAIVEVASTSIRTALSRHMAFSLSKGDAAEFDEYLSTGRRVLLASSAVVLAVGASITLAVPHIFKIPAGLSHQSQVLFLLMTLAFAATIPNIIYWSILYAKQRFDLINFSWTAGLILRAVFIFLFFSVLPKRFVNLETYGVIYLVMTWSQNYFVYWWHKIIMPGLVIHRRLFAMHRVKDILSFSLYASIHNVSTVLYNGAIQVIINVILGPTANAVFAVSLKFSSSMARISQQTIWTLTPTFTDLLARGDKKKLERLFFGCIKLMGLFAMPACVFLSVFSHEIVRRWVGGGFSLAGTLMPIHLMAVMLTLPMYATGCLFNSYAKLKVPCFMSLGATALLVVGGISLVKWAHLGLIGMSITDATVTVLYLLVFCSIYSSHLMEVPLSRFISDGLLRPFAVSWLVWGGGLFFFGKPLLAAHDWIELAALGAGLGVTYLVAGFFVVLNGEEKGFLSRAIEKVFRKFFPVAEVLIEKV